MRLRKQPYLLGRHRGGASDEGLRSVSLPVVSDVWAHRVGKGALLGILGFALLGFVGALFSREVPLFEKRLFWYGLGGAALGAYALACVTMVLHQKQSGHVSEDDLEEWDARQGTKLGGLVPFTYLLATPKQRRILTYLGKKRPTPKPSRWYWTRF